MTDMLVTIDDSYLLYLHCNRCGWESNHQSARLLEDLDRWAGNHDKIAHGAGEPATPEANQERLEALLRDVIARLSNHEILIGNLANQTTAAISEAHQKPQWLMAAAKAVASPGDVAHCFECTEPDEDPRTWCDCRGDDERCKGPCRNRAHSPSNCFRKR